MATKNNRASRYAAPIGGVFIILCVIGFFSLLGSCFQFTRSLLDNSGAKLDYEKKLLPVVMFDPPPFENPASMRPVDLLTYSVWAAVLGDKRDTYEYDDNAAMVIPASDVDMAAYNLFGPGIGLTHSSFGDYEITYLYNEDTKSYHVPVSAMTGYYTPRVEEIVKKGDIVELRVGYIPPASVLNLDLTGKGETEQVPQKYMTYELRQDKKNYFLFAIRDSDVGSTAPGAMPPMTDDLLGDLDNTGVASEDPAEQMNLLPQSSSGESAPPEGEESSSGSSASESGESSLESGSDSESSSPDGEESSEASTPEGPAPEVQG